MKKNRIDAYLIQETHLAEDFEKTIFDNYYLIHHGPPNQPSSGAKGGVAIILSPELTTQWKSSSKNKKITRGELSIGDTTRFLSITMRFETESNNKSKAYHNLCLTSVYFPHSRYKELELENFHSELSTLLSNILAKKNTTHIIGADTNSSIGTRASMCEHTLYPDKHESHLDTDPIL